jgi:serine/threonine protein kinase
MKFYESLLRLYPAEHRAEYGDMMRECFREMCQRAWTHGGAVAIGRLWLSMAADLAASLFHEYWYAWEHRHMHMIAHYQIKAHLQEGGASNIYLAHDPAHQRDVVLKVPLTGNAEFPELFVSEAVISIDIAHPSAPRFYDYRASGDQTYLAMEHIEGRSLIDILESSAEFLPGQTVIEWGIAVCDFLIYLHGKSVVHGDIKPGNLLLDSFGRLRAIDFGIAHKLPPGQTQVRGPAIGTEGYSAPEQYAGIIGVAGDIYALGATLHHLITRRDPREPKHQFLFHIYPPRALNPAVSEAFETVILKATEHKAKDRYQTAAEIKAALAACLPQTDAT